MTKNLNIEIAYKQLFTLIILVTLSLFGGITKAQNITPDVANAYCYKFGDNGSFIDMLIGETAITTIRSSSQIITQGFLQPIYLEQPCATPELVYYPNPVVKNITLGALDCDVYVNYIEAYNLFGKEVLVAVAENNMVDLSSIGVGVYILRAYAESGQLLGTVKIIKITV